MSGVACRIAPERTVAALYVSPTGSYANLPGVDCWDAHRDARQYDGPWPVVAHPPCQRWGRFWFGGTHPTSRRYIRGDDGGCFASALAAVRKWGGVLEHPANSYAWTHFGLNPPPQSGGWVVADFEGGWTCCVEQGAYGHRARKPTWLYAKGIALPSLRWGKADGEFGLMRAVSAARMAERGMDGHAPAIPRRECEATPPAFRDLLIGMAQSALSYTPPNPYPKP